MDLGVIVAIAIYFVTIVEELGETGSLGGLVKLIYVELDVMDEDKVVCCKAHLGEFVIIFSYFRTVGADSLTPLWCNLEFY